MVCLPTGRAFPGCDGTERPWFVEVCLRSLFICYSEPFLFLFLSLGKWFCNRFLYKPFYKTVFVDLMESTSLLGRNTGRGKVTYSWISPKPRKRDPHWEFVVVVVSACTLVLI